MSFRPKDLLLVGARLAELKTLAETTSKKVNRQGEEQVQDRTHLQSERSEGIAQTIQRSSTVNLDRMSTRSSRRTIVHRDTFTHLSRTITDKVTNLATHLTRLTETISTSVRQSTIDNRLKVFATWPNRCPWIER